MYSSLHHPACSQQRAQYGQKQRRQDECAGGNQQLDGRTLDLALDRGAMSRTDLATLSGQCLGKWGTQSERLPHRDGKGLERSHVQVACGGQQARPHACPRPPAMPCRPAQVEEPASDRRLAQKISSAASNERPAERPKRTTSIISDTSPSDTRAGPPAPTAPFTRAVRASTTERPAAATSTASRLQAPAILRASARSKPVATNTLRAHRQAATATGALIAPPA